MTASILVWVLTGLKSLTQLLRNVSHEITRTEPSASPIDTSSVSTDTFTRMGYNYPLANISNIMRIIFNIKNNIRLIPRYGPQASDVLPLSLN